MSDIVFTDNSDEAKEALRRAVEAALEAMGNTAVSYAKNNITQAGRVDTGAMRNSISHKVDDDSVYIGTNIEYAIYHEYGTGVLAEGGRGRKSPWAFQDDKGNWHRTRGMAPIHFLKNAVAEHADEYRKIAESIIKSQ